MKKLLFISLLMMAGPLFVCTDVFGQEVFGQQPKANTLVPVDEQEEMGYDDLPKAVKKVLRSDAYQTWEMDKVYKVGPRQAQREDHYTVRFRKGKQYMDVYLDKDGNVVDPQDEKAEEHKK